MNFSVLFNINYSSLQKNYVQKAYTLLEAILREIISEGTFQCTGSLPITASSPLEISLFEDEPLLNFCQLLVFACSRHSGDEARDVFNSLVDRYKGNLSEKNREIVLRIEKLYFPPAKAVSQSRENPMNLGNMGSMLNSMFKGMLAGPPQAPSLSPSPPPPPDID